MVQYKKDDVKEKIDAAALKIFGEKGYDNTKISDIAKESKVSVGNIYKYYGGKEEIFYSIAPESILRDLKNILINKVMLAKDKTPSEIKSLNKFHFINEDFIEYIVNNREIMLIMFEGSKSTRYGSIKDEIIDYMIETVKNHYSNPNNEVIKDSMNYGVVKIIYEKLIEMMQQVLRESSSKEEIKKAFEIINGYHLFGVTNLFK